MSKNNLFFGVLAFFLLVGCQAIEDLEDLENAPYRAEFAVPLIDTEVTLSKILEDFQDDSVLEIDPDGLIRFKYTGDVISKTSDDIFEEINRTLSEVPFIPLLEKRQALPFSTPEGLSFDQLDVKGGTLTYGFSNFLDEAVDVELRVPQVSKDGEMLKFNFTLAPGAGSFFNNTDDPYSLDKHLIVPENDSVYIEYTATTASGEDVTFPSLPPPIVQIEDIGFSYAEGYLGSEPYEGGRDTIEIDFFESWIQGDIYFEEPVITFILENSFGIPTRSIVNVFDVFTVRGEVLPLESELLTNGIDFPFPTLDEIGEVKVSTFPFTKDNSNIDVVLGAGPIAVDYEVDALTNPDGDTSIRGFITDSSYYKVNVEVELPLYGNAIDFIARDTFELSFSDFEDVDYAEFKLVSANSLPLDVDVQAYFVDENGVVLDSLLDAPSRLIRAAPVDGGGVSTGVTETATIIDFDETRFTGVKPTQEILIVASFSTINDGNVSIKVFSEESIQVRMGAIFGYQD